MPWTFTEDVEAYARAAGDLLAADPVAHTIGLTVMQNARAGSPSTSMPELYGWFTEPDGHVSGACSHTPPFPWVVEEAPPHSMRQLVAQVLADEALAERFTGVNAELAVAAELAALWTSSVGGAAELAWVQRLFVLGTLQWPDPGPPGGARPTTDGDLPVLREWAEGFARDARVGDADEVTTSLLRRHEHGGVTLWCLSDGTPVSLAARTQPAAGACRIGPVFTPAEQRGHGYGAAVTAAASAAALEVAPRVVLFTDLANPTSNALYPRIGYLPVADRCVFRFPH